MTSTSGPEDAGVERAEEQGGYGSPTPEQEVGGQEAGGQEAGGQEASGGTAPAGEPGDEGDDEERGEHDVD
ncbi:hypothetical protein [Sinomonas sp.]|jgi:hypothetical protein|uniref:hypothetical protein n=1 Tax=Sinomonas sp. TaxID=1914986 RepID=UPI002FE2D9C1